MKTSKVFQYAICAVLAMQFSLSHAQSADEASKLLDAQLAKVDHLTFYFWKGTVRDPNAKRSFEQFKDYSSLSVSVRCGGNCNSYMQKFVLHLKNAEPANCLNVPYLWIRMGDSGDIVYYVRGHIVSYGGKCYYNSNGIDSLVENNDFFFKN